MPIYLVFSLFCEKFKIEFENQKEADAFYVRLSGVPEIKFHLSSGEISTNPPLCTRSLNKQEALDVIMAMVDALIYLASLPSLDGLEDDHWEMMDYTGETYPERVDVNFYKEDFGTKNSVKDIETLCMSFHPCVELADGGYDTITDVDKAIQINVRMEELEEALVRIKHNKQT